MAPIPGTSPLKVPSDSEQVCKPAAYVNGIDFSVQKWRPGAETAPILEAQGGAMPLPSAELPGHPSEGKGKETPTSHSYSQQALIDNEGGL